MESDGKFEVILLHLSLTSGNRSFPGFDSCWGWFQWCLGQLLANLPHHPICRLCVYRSFSSKTFHGQFSRCSFFLHKSCPKTEPEMMGGLHSLRSRSNWFAKNVIQGCSLYEHFRYIYFTAKQWYNGGGVFINVFSQLKHNGFTGRLVKRESLRHCSMWTHSVKVFRLVVLDAGL